MAVNGAADPVGWIDGNVGQVFTQIKGIAVTIVYDAVVSAIILKVIKAVIGLRVSEEDRARRPRSRPAWRSRSVSGVSARVN